jgi:hypothetical protein
MTTPASKPYILKATIDSRGLSIELFGSGRSRHQRKLVYNYVASFANPDGTSACPSLTRIARENGLTRRGLIRIIQWLIKHHLLIVADERSKFGTNNYTVLFSAEDQEKCRRELQRDADEKKLSGKSARAHEGRVRGGKKAAAQRKAASDSQQSPPGALPSDSQQSPPASDSTSHYPSDSRASLVTDELAASDSQQSHDRPALPSVNPPVPSFLPSSESDGGMGGSLSYTSEDLAGKIAQWMSDLLYARKGQRHIPSADDERQIEALLAHSDAGEIVAGFYRFCLRPMGIHNLTDVFGMWWRECGPHLTDAKRKLSKNSLDAALTDLHDELLDDDAMDCKNSAYQILGLETEVAL